MANENVNISGKINTKMDHPFVDSTQNRFLCPDKFSGLSREKCKSIPMSKSLIKAKLLRRQYKEVRK